MIFSYFYDVVCCTYCFWEGTERERLQLSLTCERALLLAESREVTRAPHAKGGTIARGPLSRGFLRLPLEIESLLARRLTLFDLRGSVAEWSARRTRNAAVPGSSSALSSATLVTFPKPTTEACFLRSACRRFQCSRRLELFRKPEPLIFKHWSVSWPPTHLLVQLPATILDQVFKGGLNPFNSVLVTAFFSRKDLTDFYHFCLSEECWSLIKCYLSYKNIWDIGIISSLIFAKKNVNNFEIPQKIETYQTYQKALWNGYHSRTQVCHLTRMRKKIWRWQTARANVKAIQKSLNKIIKHKAFYLSWKMDGRSAGIGGYISCQSGNLRSLKLVRNFLRCHILLCSDSF